MKTMPRASKAPWILFQVAEALGHGSDAITRKHYISAQAMETARAAKIAEALTPKPAGTDLRQLEIMLRQLSPEQLAILMDSVTKRV